MITHSDRNREVELRQFAGIAAGESQVLYLDDSGAPPSHTGANTFVTTWLSTPVLIVTRLHEWRGISPTGGTYDRCYIVGRDLAGRTWRGYGMGRGMFCRMRMVSA